MALSPRRRRRGHLRVLRHEVVGGRQIWWSPAFWWGVEAEVDAPDVAELARFLCAGHFPIQLRSSFEDELLARLESAVVDRQGAATEPDTPTR